MFQRPWLRELRRRVRRTGRGRRGEGWGPSQTSPHQCFWITILVTGLSAAVLIGMFEAKLRPVAVAAARTQVQNTVTTVLEQEMSGLLADCEVSYDDLITVQRDGDGRITALQSNMASMNQLRSSLIRAALEHLRKVHVDDIKIPAGSLSNFVFFWGQGPGIRVRSMSVGAIKAEFESRFSDAGVNQTHHQVWLHISVPMNVLLPNGPLEVPVDTRFCLAETVIVGQIPNTCLTPSLNYTGAGATR